MAAISIVNRSGIDATKRIDAEYYHPRYIRDEKILADCDTVLLSRVAFVSDGNHLSIAQAFDDKNGVRYLRGQDISAEMCLTDRNIVFIPKTAFELLSRSHIHNGDILITIVGANTGLVALVDNAPEELTASCKLGIVRPTGISAGYLYAVLTSRFGQDQILRTKRGGGQTGLVLPDLRQLEIARFSDTLEYKIERIVVDGHKQIVSSKSQLESAQTQLLTALNLHNWQPPRFLTWTRDASQIVRAGRWDGEYFHPRYAAMIDRVPASVDLVPLGRIVHLEKGIEVGGAEYREEGIPFWRVANLTTQGMDEGSVKYISPEFYRLLREAYEPRQGEILLSKDGTPGLAHYMEEGIEGITSGGILRLSLKEPINPYYLEAVLNSSWVQMQVEQSAGGSIIKHWKPSEVRGTIIPRLAHHEEAAIGALVSQSHAARKSAQELLQRAKSAVEIAIESGETAALEWLNAS